MGPATIITRQLLEVALAASLLLNLVMFMLMVMAGRLREKAENERDAAQLVAKLAGRQIERRYGPKKARRIGGAVTLDVERALHEKVMGGANAQR